MSKIRQRRTADHIQRQLSEMLQREMRDPRLQGVTVTKVMIDRELSHANVYVNAMGDESRQDEVMAALAKAGAYLRRELAGRLQARTVPELHFQWDFSLANAAEVHEIFENLDIPPTDEDAEGAV